MMNRFQPGAGRGLSAGKLLPVGIFCLVFVLFLGGLSSVSENTAQKEAESLKDSIRRSAVHCYALEGFYPEDLSYLEEYYGISYDSSKYVVSYEIIGENLMPDIMVIPLKDKGGSQS